MPEIFAKGDQVRPVKVPTGSALFSINEVYVVGAVQDLENPDHWYVDPYYWNREDWSWARDKTRLQVAGHPQVVFLEGILRAETNIPPIIPDPENKGRQSFSGSWFEKLA